MSVGWFMRIVNTYSSCGRVGGLLVEVYSRHNYRDHVFEVVNDHVVWYYDRRLLQYLTV